MTFPGCCAFNTLAEGDICVGQSTTSVDRRQVLAGSAALAIGAPSLARAQTPRIKVAVLLPRSGFFAQSGQSCHRGALAAPKVLADLGYNVDIVNVDVESSADVARTQAEKVINEGAHCIIGAFDSGLTLSIAQVCEQRHVPLIINIAAAPQITEQGYKYLVRNFQTGGQLVTNGLKLIKDISAATKVDFKTAVFLHANDTFGTGQRTAMDAIFPKADMPFKLVESIAYDPRAQDLSVEVTRMRSIAPDLVMVVTRAGDAIKLVRDMVRQRFEPKAVISPGAPGLYDEEFYQALGPLADDFMFNLPWANPKSEITQALDASFKVANPNNRFAVDSFNAGFTFEAIMVAADAFKRAGSTDGATLMDAIRKTNLDKHVMIGGPIAFNDKGQNVNIGNAAVQNQKQTPVVVLPTDVAVATPVLPMRPWQGRK